MLKIFPTLFFILPVLLCPQLKASDDGSGLSLSAAADLFGAFNLSKNSGSRDAFDVREAELSLFAPVDHHFDGILSLAAHRENGEAVFEIHEASIGSSKLISGLNFKFGQYFLGIGRLNRFHRHDWPFISAPRVHTEFFGDEGILDSGMELSYLLPFSSYANITAGVTNGRTFGHSHNDGEKPTKPTHYARVSLFFEPANLSCATGLSYLSRTNHEGIRMTLSGFDATLKIQERSYPELLIQSEIWHREQTPKNGPSGVSAGGYLYSQYGISESLFAGIRLDYFTVLSLKNANGEKISNSETAMVPTITYKNSEFAAFKLAYNRSESSQKNQDSITKSYIEVQTIFILGAHPAHEF